MLSHMVPPTSSKKVTTEEDSIDIEEGAMLVLKKEREKTEDAFAYMCVSAKLVAFMLLLFVCPRVRAFSLK